MSSEKKINGCLLTPFRVCVYGASGSGKTNFYTQLILNREKIIDKEINYIKIFYGIYTPELAFLQQILGDKLEIIEGVPEDGFEQYINPSLTGIFVLDDIMGSPKLEKLFTKQSSHGNVSLIYISQNLFYPTPSNRTIIRNLTGLVIFANPLDNTVINILARRVLPSSPQTFINIFENVTNENPFAYLFIDGQIKTPHYLRFRTQLFESDYQRVFIPQEYKAKSFLK